MKNDQSKPTDTATQAANKESERISKENSDEKIYPLLNEYRELDWPEVVRHIQSFASSGTGKISLSGINAMPSAEAARACVQDIFCGIEVLRQGARPFMESLDFFDAWFGRLKRQAVLKTIELKDVRSFCHETLALKEVLNTVHNRWTARLRAELMDATEPLAAVDQLITPRGEIRSDASEKLWQLHREKDSLTQQIDSTLNRLVKANDMQVYLQDRFVTTREGRWVLPVRSGKQHSVDGVIHGSSQTKQTVYMEPEQIVPLNNRLRQVEVEIEEEIERLLVQISEYLARQTEGFAQTRNSLQDADVLLAKSQWSLQIDARDFEFTENEISLVDVAHPLMRFTNKRPVSNTVQLQTEKSILLLSGPNAGGKTVLLKAVGLAAQMARCGLPLACENGSKLPFLNHIHIGIGDAQSVDAELSTFAAHMQLLNRAIGLRGHNSLILIDEICGSTDPEEGAALARAFIEQFARHQCFGVITSHLGPLKAGWAPESAVMSGSMEYDSKSGRPTYIFLPGVPGDSLAIQTAKRVGVQKPIVDRAIELLSPTTRSRLAGLEELEQLKSDIQSLRAQLKKDQVRAQNETEKYNKLIAEFEKSKDELLHKSVRQAEKKVDDLIAQAKVEQTFKRHTALQEIKTELPQIVKSSTVSAQNAGQGAGENPFASLAQFAKNFPPGSKIYVPHLQQDGIIQGVPNAKGEVLVLAGSLRLNMSWQELKPPMQAENPTAKLMRRSGNVSVALMDQERALDLRGMSSEEAISALERELDLAATRREDRIKVIHGHGTEVLKKAVRTYLSRSNYVKKWKAGGPEHGGDGVTLAELGSSSE